MAFTGLTAAGGDTGNAAQRRVGYRIIPHPIARWEDVEKKLRLRFFFAHKENVLLPDAAVKCVHFMPRLAPGKWRIELRVGEVISAAGEQHTVKSTILVSELVFEARLVKRSFYRSLIA